MEKSLLDHLGLEAPKASSDGLRLKEVILPSGFVPGFDVEYSGNTGNNTKHNLDGFDGIKFVGAGKDFTHIFPAAWSGITVSIGSQAKRVEFHGVTIHGGWLRAIHQGAENIPMNGGTFTPMVLVLADCHIQADEPDSYEWVQTRMIEYPLKSKQFIQGQTSTWGVFTYNASIQAVRTTFDWKRGAEHAVYMHGVSSPGSVFDECHWISSGGECIKLATRPGEAFWQAGGLLVQNCSFRDWGPQPWSWRGGGGIVVQGGGINVFVLNCQFFGGPGHAKSRAVMIDDGGKDRFFSAITGEPGKGPANGWILVEDTLMVGDGQPSWALLSRVGTLTLGTDVARGVAYNRCGLYSRDELISKLEIVSILNDNLFIDGCNTPEIRSIADSITPVGADAMVTGPLGSFEIAKGYKGGIFLPVDPAPLEA